MAHGCVVTSPGSTRYTMIGFTCEAVPAANRTAGPLTFMTENIYPMQVTFNLSRAGLTRWSVPHIFLSTLSFLPLSFFLFLSCSFLLSVYQKQEIKRNGEQKKERKKKKKKKRKKLKN